MMMPTRPRTNLIVGQTRLALGALQAIFDSMLRLLHASQLRERRLGRSVGKMVIVFERLLPAPLARYEQQLLGTFATPFRLSGHPRADDLDHQRAFLRVADFDRGPGSGGQRGAPLVHSLERHDGRTAMTAISRR